MSFFYEVDNLAELFDTMILFGEITRKPDVEQATSILETLLAAVVSGEGPSTEDETKKIILDTIPEIRP